MKAVFFIFSLVLFGLTSPISSQVQVPPLEIDYSKSVEDWWATHPYNPDSPNHIPVGQINHPAPQLNVQTQFGGNIQAAIDSAECADGCTLYFPAGRYAQDFEIVDKGNIHFVGENRETTFLQGVSIWACEGIKDYNQFNLQLSQYPEYPDTMECFTSRPKNFYFYNMTFDGGGRVAWWDPDRQIIVDNAFFARGVSDVLFDNVRFINYEDSKGIASSIVGSNGASDNIWFRNCVFEGSGRHAIYLDGTHGSGAVNSQLNGWYGSGHVLHLTNDDYTHDINQNGQFDLEEQRNAQYNVYANNDLLHITNGYAFNIHGMQNLIIGNTTQEFTAYFAWFSARCSQRHYVDGFTYENYYNKVIDNDVYQVLYLTTIDSDGGKCAGEPTDPINMEMHGRSGKYVVKNNNIRHSGRLLSIINEIATIYPIDGPNPVCGNTVEGTLHSSNQTCG
jgi:hypothetical protein